MKTRIAFCLLALTLATLSAKAAAPRRGGQFPHTSRTLAIIKSEVISALAAMTSQQEQEMSGLLKEEPKLPIGQMNLEVFPINMVNSNYLIDIVSRLDVTVEGQSPSEHARYMNWGGNYSEGFYIVALKDLFVAYGQVPYQQLPENHKIELRRFLFKEPAHTWGYDDEQADHFARMMMISLFKVDVNTLTDVLPDSKAKSLPACFILSGVTEQVSYPSAFATIAAAKVYNQQLEQQTRKVRVWQPQIGTQLLEDPKETRNAALSVVLAAQKRGECVYDPNLNAEVN